MVEVREYINAQGSSPFAKWFNRLNAIPAARITMALARVELGNFSDHKSVGAGVWELRLDFGSGFRVLFWQGWTPACNPVRWRYEETTTKRYRDRQTIVEGLQKAEKRGEIKWY